MYRFQNGHIEQQNEEQIQCPICKLFYNREDMDFSRDCMGIVFRLLCYDCLEDVYSEKGYDGEKYYPWDENIDEDY